MKPSVQKVRRIIKEELKKKLVEQKEISRKVSDWNYQTAADYVKKLYEHFNYPAVLSENGYAEWRNIAGFKRISVRDENVYHDFPKEHYDFVYSTKEINVPAELYSDFGEVTGSIIIDGLKKEVTARCGDIVANAVTLGFVEDVLGGDIDPSKNEYARRINNLVIPDWFNDPMNEIND